jgi:hypothetical protein
MREMLREPVKPGRKQSTAEKHHDNVNDQRPKRPHARRINTAVVRAKREFNS